MPVPENLPVPFVFAPAATAPVRIATPESSATAVVLQSFAALGDDNTSIPPDVSGAVGRDRIIVALNTQFRIQNRSGNTLSTVQTRSFFDAVRSGNRTFDPRVMYDPRADRWYVCEVGDQHTTSQSQRTGSFMVLAVSRSGDPAGTWDLYRFNAPSDVWFDFPMMGFDASHVIVTMNLFNISDNKFSRAAVMAFDKTQPDNAPLKLEVSDSGGGLFPVTALDDSATAMYLVQRWNGSSRGSGFLRLYTVTSAGVAPVGFITTPSPWAGHSPTDSDFAPQSGSVNKVDACDDRIQAAVFRDGSIWAVQGVYLPAAAATHASVQWWQISPGATTIQRGLIDDPQGEFFYTHPSIAVNRRDDVVIAGTRFSATTKPSAFLSFRMANDAANAVSAPLIFKEGESSYYKTSSGDSNRWGDYTTAVVDPLNDTEFWTIQEYAATPNGGVDRWGTWWVHLDVAALAAGPHRRAARH